MSNPRAAWLAQLVTREPTPPTTFQNPHPHVSLLPDDLYTETVMRKIKTLHNHPPIHFLSHEDNTKTLCDIKTQKDGTGPFWVKTSDILNKKHVDCKKCIKIFNQSTA